MRIAMGADHGGYRLKDQLGEHLRSKGHNVLDLGTSSDEAVDYPKFAEAVASQVAQGDCERGIVVDGAGIGSAMAANKVPGARAALAYDLSSALNSREHNDANVLTLGAGLIGPTLARQIVDAWLAAECREERHLSRVAMLSRIEQAARGGSPELDASRIGEADLARIARQLETLLGESAPRVAIEKPEARGAPPPARDAPAPDNIAAYIDHTLLKPDAGQEAIKRLCAEAREHRFAAVCTNAVWVPLVTAELKGSGVLPCAVVGFPLGASYPETKAFEARRAIREGAREIDMVINVSALKAGDDRLVLHDIRAVVEACGDGRAACKVILEAALLTDEEKRRACRLARQARAGFVKTSTGFGPGGATVEDVALMASAVRGSGMGIKAAGGIRSFADARAMIAAGATRIGASAGVAIVREAGRQAVGAGT